MLQATTNLVQWTDRLVEQLAGYAELLVDTEAGMFGQRFYRLVRQGSYLELTSDLAMVGAGVGTNRTYQITLPPSVEVPLVIEASTSLHDWFPIGTDALSPLATLFSDPTTTNLRTRFYRLRLSR